MSLSLRRAVIFGAPLLAYIVGMLHPTHVGLAGDPWPYIGIHLALPLVIGLLAWMIVLLVEGVDNRAASAARVLVVPFAISYGFFTGFVGLAYGVMVWKAGDLPVDQQQGAVALIHDVFHNSVETAVYFVAGLVWFAAILAVVVALRRRAPLAPLVLLALGALVFANTHERPWGPGGMAAILAAVVWLELKPDVLRSGR
jgi:hypothetical protein